MMFTFSKYGADPQNVGAIDAVGYMSDRDVLKPTGGGVRQRMRRYPAPEVLIGDMALIRAAIRAAPGKLKYRSGVLSFAREDVDVISFNAGNPDLRGAVDLALGLWVEVAFAGIPETARPPIFATTHTHTGRLEVNFLSPRWVLRPDGKIRSYNPDPPGPESRAMWRAYQDVLNARFEWADPETPDRAQLVQLPSWRVKLRAELRRAGDDLRPDLREHLAQRVLDAVRAGIICNRGDVVGWLRENGQQEGFVIHDVQPAHITIGAADILPHKRTRLKGLLFCDKFSSPAFILPNETELQLARDARTAQLATAPDRLQLAWEARSRFNLSRYGLNAWPPPEFCAADWRGAPVAQPPFVIPVRHPDPQTIDQKKPFRADPTAILDADGTSIPASAARDGSDHPRPAGTTERKNLSLGGADPAAGSLDRRFDRAARALTGPIGAGRILAALTVHFRALMPQIVARLTLRRLVQSATPVLLNTLAETQHSLELLNDTLIQQAKSFETRRHADASTVRDARKSAGIARRTNHSAAQTLGSPWRDGRRSDRAPRALDRSTGHDLKQSPYISDHAERHQVLPGGFTAHREAPCHTAQSSEGSRHPSGRGGSQAGDVDQLARRTAGPTSSRAGLLRLLLSIGTAADPDTRLSIRILHEEETMLRSQGCVKATTAAVNTETALAVHRLPSEIWVFSGSQAAIAAMSECWREHFGIEADELTENDVGWEPD